MGGRSVAPYVIDVQNQHLKNLITRVVIPLRPLNRLQYEGELGQLFPRVAIDSQPYFLDVPAMAAVLDSGLSNPVTGSPFVELAFPIADALDKLLGAY